MNDLIRHHFPDVTDDQMEKFMALKPLYEEWNAMINVISRKDMDSFNERHLIHSLAIAFYWQPKKGSVSFEFML